MVRFYGILLTPIVKGFTASRKAIIKKGVEDISTNTLFYYGWYVMTNQLKFRCVIDFLKFYQSLIKSDNSTIKVLLRHAIDGSGSSVANSINL